MIITLATALALAAQCAPAIAPETLLSVVHVESGFNTLAIGVNGSPRVSAVATSSADAAAKASALIAAGRSVDLGLAQINSKNLGWLGLSVEQAFEPCANLAAAARVLQDGYARSGAQRNGEQTALRTAFSYYNTGSAARGFANGYVAKVARAAENVVPAIRTAASSSLSEADETSPVAGPSKPLDPPAWDVFAQRPAPDAFVIRNSTPTSGDVQ